MRTQYQLQLKINDLINRQKDIEFMLNNKRVKQDDEWLLFVDQIKVEYGTNAERIGYLESQLKLLKLQTA